MIEIRPLHQDEIPQAKEFVPAEAPEPDWKNCWAMFADGELSLIFAMEQRLVVEPLYRKNGNHHLQAFGTMTWIDGFLRGIATQQGKGGYEFFVGDENPKFQEFIRKHLPVKEGREKAGLYFLRKFEV